ncbi:MAG: DUF4058 family protein [Oculatellaceae cyanobacterium Prado106]|jgi:hypothetical protein|nr:DUF4058 family protein [Oculatellaceae cyanobacterium Prado106]
MPFPFPGMNPYLEASFLWREVHSRLIVALANHLGSRLRPKYYTAIETRTYLEDESEGVLVGVPDAIVYQGVQSRSPQPSAVSAVSIPASQPQKVRLVEAIEVKERFLEVRQVITHAVIAAIEILSPNNKRGDGRVSYLKKRQALLESQTHLVELDLLRAYPPMPMTGASELGDYRILVSNATQRPEAELYGFSLRDRIPLFPLPLQPEDELLTVDLYPLLQTVYDEGNFDLRIDYSQPVPEPALSEGDRAWVQQCLASLENS